MPNDYAYVGPYRLEKTLGTGSFGKVKCIADPFASDS